MKSRYVYSLTPVYAAAERCLVKQLNKIRFYSGQDSTLEDALRAAKTNQEVAWITKRISSYTRELVNEMVRYRLFQYFLSSISYDEGELVYKSAMVLMGDDPEEIEDNREECFKTAIREIEAIVDLLPSNRYLVANVDIKNTNLYVTTGEDVRILQYELEHGVNSRWSGQVFDVNGQVYGEVRGVELDLGNNENEEDSEATDTLLDILARECDYRKIDDDSFQEPLMQPVSTQQPENVRPTKSSARRKKSENRDRFVIFENLSLYPDRE